MSYRKSGVERSLERQITLLDLRVDRYHAEIANLQSAIQAAMDIRTQLIDEKRTERQLRESRRGS